MKIQEYQENLSEKEIEEVSRFKSRKSIYTRKTPTLQTMYRHYTSQLPGAKDERVSRLVSCQIAKIDKILKARNEI
jgi:phage terminase large subunit